MISKFHKLASRVEDLWATAGKEKSSFPEVCFNELSNFEFPHSLEELESELALWIQGSSLPKQLNVYNNFGQPPVTLFNNGKFVVDLYFWMNIDTSIHSHSFAGAFKVLYGQSLHEVFEVKPKKVYAEDVMSTDISRVNTQLLNQGATERILAGNQFNHRVVHLDTPTVTLCIRTIDDKEDTQWHHFPNGLSIEKRAPEEKVLKNLFYYEYLFNRNPEKGMAFLAEIIESWSISEMINLYEQMTTDSMGLSEDACGFFFETLNSIYGASEWYAIYESFYEQLEDHVHAEGDSAVDRFMEHAINSNYSYVQASQLLIMLQGHPLSEMQEMNFSTLEK